MAELKIVLGNKNYSSWSLRPWLMLAHLDVPFDEEVIQLDQEDTKELILRHSPSGRVPCLHHGPLIVWDSLAIGEYLNECFPAKSLWPADSKARMTARAVSAEMHSGFAALRDSMPMNIRASKPGKGRTPATELDIRRIVEIWRSCRGRFGDGGPFLFGSFSIADAMFAPVVTRFRTYEVPLSGSAAEYASTVWAMPSLQKWAEAARAEPWTIAKYDDL
jgi:glutathione S-transferase